MRINYMPLADFKLEAHAQIDKAAGDIRSRFITLGGGMDMVYGEKRREAEALMADTNLSASETPHLQVEAAKFGVERFEIATTIIIKAYEWANVSAKIEEIRVWQKHLVDESTTVPQVKAAATIDWSPVTSYL